MFLYPFVPTQMFNFLQISEFVETKSGNGCIYLFSNQSIDSPEIESESYELY